MFSAHRRTAVTEPSRSRHRDQPRRRARRVAGTAAVAAALAAAPAAPAAADEHVVDRTSRAAVAEAYQERLVATYDVAPGWTGSTESCTVGTEREASKQATVTAMNYYRGMAGLPAVELDEGLSRKALAGAMMMHASGRLSHTPSPDWRCHTAEGAEAAGRSNLGLNVPTGGRTMSGYMADRGISSVGHRLWILHPGVTTVGTGSTGVANALWVVPDGRPATPASTPDWTMWPTAGWFPWGDAPTSGGLRGQGPTTLHLWSVGSNRHPNADYSGATVTATVDGQPLDVEVVNRRATVGTGRSLVFDATRPDGARFDTSRDTEVAVTVEGVRAGGTTLEPLRYTVDLFDPETAPAPAAEAPAAEGAAPPPRPAPAPAPPTTTQPAPAERPASPATTVAPRPAAPEQPRATSSGMWAQIWRILSSLFQMR